MRLSESEVTCIIFSLEAFPIPKYAELRFSQQMEGLSQLQK